MNIKKLPQSPLMVFLAVLLASTLLYFPSLFNGFALDDYSRILNVGTGVSFKAVAESLKEIGRNFDHDAGSFRPIPYLLRAVLYSLFGTDAFFYHAANIFLYALVCFYIFQLLERLDGRRQVAFLTTLLFLVHPIHSYAVSHICGHEILLSGLFVVLSVRNYIEYSILPDPKRLVLSLIFYVCALLTREMSIVTPFLLLAVARIHFRQSWQQTLRNLSPVIFITFLFVFYKFLFFPRSTVPDIAGISISDIFGHVTASVQLFGWYFVKIVWPFDIVFMMNLSAVTAGKAFIYGAVAVAAMVSLMLVIWKGNGTARLAGIWFAGGAALAMMLTGKYYSAMGDILQPHWLFLADAGFFWLMIDALYRASSSWPKLFTKTVVGGTVIFYVLLTMSYIPLLYDTRTYCSYWLQRVPYNPYAYVYLSRFFKYHGNYEQVVVNSKKILTWGANETIYYELAEAYEHLGNDKAVYDTVEEALRYFPQSSSFHSWMGTLQFNKAEYDEAIDSFKKAVFENRENVETYHNLANAYLMKGAFGEAVKVLTQAMGQAKDDAQKKILLSKRAICFSKLQQNGDLNNDLQSFFQLRPTAEDMAGFINLCISLGQVDLGEKLRLMGADIRQ